MTGRILLAALAAAVAMFVWSALAHTVLGIGQIGFKTFDAAAEPAVLDSVNAASKSQGGLYVAPGWTLENMGAEGRPTHGPSLVAIYRADTSYEMSPMMMIGEFVLELVQAIILAFLLAQFMASFGARVAWATAAGVMVGIATNGSYHIWYGFPHDYTFAQIGMQVVQYLLAGVVLALLLPKNRTA